jgi:hypothetical protein
LRYITPEDKIFANQDHIKMQKGIPVNYKQKYLKTPSNFGDTLRMWLRNLSLAQLLKFLTRCKLQQTDPGQFLTSDVNNFP